MAWEYAVVGLVALEVEKPPTVCNCAVTRQLEESQDYPFRDLYVQTTSTAFIAFATSSAVTAFLRVSSRASV